MLDPLDVTLFCDNTFMDIYLQTTGSRVDLPALKEEFNTGDTIEANLFFQKNADLEWSTYKYLCNTFEHTGWKVHRGLDQSLKQISYTPFFEGVTLTAEAMAKAGKAVYNDTQFTFRDTRFVFCVNALAYEPLIRQLSEQFESIDLVLVCDTTTANDALMELFDEVYDLRDVGVPHVPGEEAS